MSDLKCNEHVIAYADSLVLGGQAVAYAVSEDGDVQCIVMTDEYCSVLAMQCNEPTYDFGEV